MRKIARQLLESLPYPLKTCLAATKIFLVNYGFFKSVLRRASIDRRGLPIPWYTYPAIDFLVQIDFSDKTVFEYGCGNSTLW